MKKLLFLFMASFLVLTACGNNEEKTENKKETTSTDKKSKKDDKKSNEDKEDDKSNEEIANEEPQSQEQQNTEQPVQSQEQQPVQSQEQAPVVEEQPAQQEPIDKEQWARDNIEGGTDAHAADEMEAFYQQERAKELEKEEEPSDWVKGQDEWMNASESERTEIRKADAEKYGYEYDPSDYE